MARRAFDPGRLRVFARLETPTSVPDGAGGHSENWDFVATVPLLLEPLGASRDWSADKRRETATYRATYRARTDAASDMRFVVRGRPMTILSIRDADDAGSRHIAILEETGR